MEKRSLVHLALSALKWNYFGLFVRVASSLAIGVVLARLLGPKPFGQVAIASLVIGLGTLMADFGFGAALIQKQEVTDDEIRFVFTAQVLLGAALTSIGAALSGAIARAFHQPEVAPVLRVLMLTFVLQSLGQTASCLLRRGLKFKQIQIAQVGSYLIAYIAVGIPMGYFGFGVWALVTAQIIQTVLNAIVLYSASLHSIRPFFSLNHRNLFHFGAKVIGTNFANWIIYNLDTAVAGRYFGAYDLGLYNRAFYSATMLVNSAVVGFQQVLFPGTARAEQREKDKLKRAYMGALTLVALVIMPLYAGIAVVPTTVVVALYGAQWEPSAPLLAAFAVAMPFYALMCIAGPFLWGMNRVESEFKVQLLVGLIAVPSFLLSYRISLLSLAWAVAAIYLLRFVMMTHAMLRTFEITAASVIMALFFPAMLALVIALAIYLADRMFAISGPALAKLGADLCVGAMVFGLALTSLRNRIYGAEGRWLLKNVQRGIPKLFFRFLPE
jgi:PST family polysaccharide transporter